MTQPTLTVEIAFVANPYGTLVWTDVSQYIRSQITTKRGRSYELDQAQAGTLQLVLQNTDGRFDPTNADGAYAPYVLPLRPVRVRATYSGTTYDIWRGFIERWPQQWQLGGSYGTVTVTAVDAFAVLLSKKYGPRFSDQVLADGASLYARMNGSITNVGSGGGSIASTSPWVNGGVAGLLNGSSDTAVITTSTTVQTAATWVAPTLTKWTAELLVNTNTTDTSASAFFLIRFGNTLRLIYDSVNDNYKLKLYNSGASTIVDTGLTVARGVTTHVAITVDNSAAPAVVTPYVNGVAGASFTFPQFGAAGSFDFGATVNVNTGEHAVLDELLIFPSILNASQIALHYSLSLTSSYCEFAQEDAGARIGHVLDTVNWPAADRIIDTATSVLQSTGSVDGSTALDIALQAAKTDAGIVFVDGAGRVVFQNRKHGYAAGLQPVATIGEAGVPYQGDITIDFDPTYVYNDTSLTQANSTPAYVSRQKATSSQNQYGVRSYEDTVPLADQADVDSLAKYIVNIYAAPQPRIAQVSIELRSKPAYLPQVLGREIGDVITVTRTPLGAPAISIVCVIQGIQHTITADKWVVTFLISPRPAPLWIVGDPVYGVVGSTTVVAY